MTGTSHPAIDELFWDLIQLETAEAQESFLRELKQRDAETAAQLRSLLQQGPVAQRMFASLDDPDLTAGLVAGEAAFSCDAPQTPASGDSSPNSGAAVLSSGTVVGPYKLLEPIGEGGMGIVYLAQQSKPVRRKVAIKIIKPGMDSRQVVARFEAERQALAMMEHPNIARVLDAGTTQGGLPFFVMELVKGIPITEYCDRARMPNRQRLTLFRDACSAIQHAHNKGIIHRDIKPSNVLVTEQDGQAIVKVIDFGVAKALTDNLTDKTLFTGMFQLMGTPLYMSPEQAGLSNVDVDIRSDVYSLGVLLYELLSGSLPIDRDEVRNLSFDQLQKKICENEPPRPSRKLSTLQEDLKTIAERRSIDPRAIHRQLAGELDWIVMQAIDKDRNRRYQSAREFAEDIERYLDGASVLACPPSISYRFRKFAQRNKTLVVGSVAAAVLLFTSMGLILNFAFEAQAAHQTAKQNLDQADRDFDRALSAIDLVLEEIQSERFRRLRDFKDTRRDIAEKSIQLYEDIAAEHGDDRRTNLRAARAMGKLASFYFTNDNVKMTAYFAEAAEKLAALHEASPDDIVVQLEYGELLASYGTHMEWRFLGPVEERRQRLETAIDLLSSLDLSQLGDEKSAQVVDLLRATLVTFAMHLQRSGEFSAAQSIIQQSIDVDPAPDAKRERIKAFITLGSGDPARAHGQFERAVEVAREDRLANPGDHEACQVVMTSEEHFAKFLDERGEHDLAALHRKAARDFATALNSSYSLNGDGQYYSWILSTYPELTLENVRENVEIQEAEIFARALHWTMESEAYAKALIYLYEEHSSADPIRQERVQRALTRNAFGGMVMKRLVLGVADLAERRYEDAASHFTEAVSESGGSFYRGRTVRKLFDHIIASKPTEKDILLSVLRHPVLMEQRARIEFSLGNTTEARRLFGQAVEESTGMELSAHDHFSRGDFFLQFEDHEQALVSLNQAIAMDESQGHWYKRRALANFCVRNLDNAIADVQTALQKNPKDASSLYWIPTDKLVACTDESFRDGLLEVARHYAQKQPANAARQVAHGYLLATFERTEEALKVFESALETSPNDADILYRRAVALLQLERWDEATDCLKKLKDARPAWYLPSYYAALLSLKSGDVTGYRDVCEQMLAAPYASEDLASKYFTVWTTSLYPDTLLDYQPAIQMAHAMIEGEPQNSKYHVGLGAICLRSGDSEAAQKHLMDAGKLGENKNTSDAYRLYFVAMTEAALMNSDAAERAFRLARQMSEAELHKNPPWHQRTTLKLLDAEAEAMLAATRSGDD